MFQEYQVNYAGFWWRVLAYIIDGLIISIVFFPLGIAVGLGIGASGAADPDSPVMPAINLGLNGFQIAATWLYYAFCESSTWQGTIGKKVCGLRVTDMNGNQISFGFDGGLDATGSKATLNGGDGCGIGCVYQIHLCTGC